jgi:hypothetical protein
VVSPRRRRIAFSHLRSIAKRHDEILGAGGIREVVVFYSSAQAMKPHQGDLPFAIISDPRRALYEEFGVQIALRSALSPTALGRLTCEDIFVPGLLGT